MQFDLSNRSLTVAARKAQPGAVRGLAFLAIVSVVYGQPPPVAQWQIDAGGKRAFDVASVKPATGEFRSPSFPLDESDAFNTTGGRFFAQFPLTPLIHFAWKFPQAQMVLASLPKWASTDRFEIEARVAGNPTKDQMRLMVQALLAERFHLALHFETRETPSFAMTLNKAGKPGPKLKPHSEGPACDVVPGASGAIFPERCDVQALLLKPGRMRLTGSRNTTLDLIAGSLTALGALERPVINQTGLAGRYDFTLEWFDEAGAFARPPGADAPNAAIDPQGPGFLEALREQLGLKLESTKGPVQFLVIDHLERPSEN